MIINFTNISGLAIGVALLITAVAPSERGNSSSKSRPSSSKPNAQLLPKTSKEKGKTPVLQKSGSEESLQALSNKDSIDRLPGEILREIFVKTPFYYVREILARVSKRFKGIAYSKDIHPTELKLIYDSKNPDKKCSYMQDETQRIDFDVFRTLEITIKGDASGYEELDEFSYRNDIELLNLENLKINMEYTSSNHVLDVFTNLLEKTRKLIGFSLKLDDLFFDINEFHRTRKYNDEKFWNALKNSRAKDVEFAVAKKNHYELSDNFGKSNVKLMFYMFQTRDAYLKNLQKLTMIWHPLDGVCTFVISSVKNSYSTIKEINVEFGCLIHWMFENNHLHQLDELSNCRKLEKLMISMPAIRHSARSFRTYAIRTWRKLLDVVKSRPKLYLGLTTNTNYLYAEEFLDFFNGNPEIKIPLQYLKLILDPSERDFKTDVATVLKVCPKLEVLEIVYNLESDTNSIQFLLERAKKLKDLKDFSISYRQRDAGLSDIYQNLLNLVQDLRKLAKVTVKVASEEYQRRAFGTVDVQSPRAEQIIRDDLHRTYVKNHILNDSAKRELESLFGNSFKVESKLATVEKKDDAHVLILKRKL